MERDLFDWQEWDTLANGSTVYYDCTLRKHIGDFAPGTVFKRIVVDYGRERISLGNSVSGPQAVYRIALQVLPESTNYDNRR